MVSKSTITGFMVALMALSVPLVYADTGDVKSAPAAETSDKDGGWHHGSKDHMMGKILNLSEDQEKQLKDSKEKQKEAMKSVFEQMKTNREAFDAEIVKAAPDMAKINDLQTQIKTVQAQMVDNHLNAILEIKKILTPEQFAGYMALEKEEHMKMGHHKMGHKHWEGKSDKDHGDEDKD